MGTARTRRTEHSQWRILGRLNKDPTVYSFLIRGCVCLSGAENEVSHGGGDFILKYAQNMQFISPETRNIAPIFHVGRAVILLMLSTYTRLI